MMYINTLGEVMVGESWREWLSSVLAGKSMDREIFNETAVISLKSQTWLSDESYALIIKKMLSSDVALLKMTSHLKKLDTNTNRQKP